MNDQKNDTEGLPKIQEFIAKHQLMPHICFAVALIFAIAVVYDVVNYGLNYALRSIVFVVVAISVLYFCWELFIRPLEEYNKKVEKIIRSKIDLSIVKKDGKKICLSWAIKGEAVENNELLSGSSLLGYRLADGLPHDPLEAKRLGKLIINTRKLSGEVIDQDIKPGQTAYYALFVQGEMPPNVVRENNNEGANKVPYSAMATAIERAPEGEMAKLARKIRYQELEERLKNKRDQGGTIAEMARKDMEDAVSRIENVGEFFKNIKETKEKNKEKIKYSNMSDEDKDELLEAIEELADEVIYKKIGMGNIT